MKSSNRIAVILTIAIVALALPAFAAEWSVNPSDAWCDDKDSDDSLCEVRTASFAANGATIVVDAGRNGGIEVSGSSGSEIQIRARIRARDRQGRGLPSLDQIRILADGNSFSTDGPDQRNWSVSFQVSIPRNSDLRLETNNGGIRIDDVDGEIRFRTQNGGIRLQDLAGDVEGRTTNGGLYVRLSGSRWLGEGLNVSTTNGGINLEIPEGYSADLETGTTNGSIQLDFPVTVQGKIGKRLKTALGSGGAPVQVTTTNGGVRIDQI